MLPMAACLSQAHAVITSLHRCCCRDTLTMRDRQTAGFSMRGVFHNHTMTQRQTDIRQTVACRLHADSGSKPVGNIQTWCDSWASSSLARRLATRSRSRCHLSRRLLMWDRISSLAWCLLAISSSPTSYNCSHRGCRAFTSCSNACHHQKREWYRIPKEQWKQDANFRVTGDWEHRGIHHIHVVCDA